MTDEEKEFWNALCWNCRCLKIDPDLKEGTSVICKKYKIELDYYDGPLRNDKCIEDKGKEYGELLK